MNRYIRLETMWDASPWIDILSAEAQLVWIKLLCYVKGHGFNGRVKALAPITAARMWNVGDESVRQLFKAAEMHGAVVIDDTDWIITKWAEYQGDSTNAARQSRFRAAKSNGSNALRNARNTEKEKEKEKEKDSNYKKEKTSKSGITSKSVIPDCSNSEISQTEDPEKQAPTSNPTSPVPIGASQSLDLSSLTLEQMVKMAKRKSTPDDDRKMLEFTIRARQAEKDETDFTKIGEQINA